MYMSGALVMILEVVLALNDDGCYKNITSRSGVIKSPNYPGLYENNLDCIYRIRSPSDKPVTLVFVDFNVELTSDCGYDYVELHDGDQINLGKYCGQKIPDPVIALSGVLVVKFHTDYNTKRRGFNAFYNDSQDCVHIIEKAEGSIVTPNFPEHYPANILCLYLIHSLNGLPMNLTFLRFVSHCDNDSLTIKDGMERTASTFGPFCGNILPMIPIITKGTVFLIFEYVQSKPSRRFSAVFREEAFLDCSGHLNVTSGRVQSPNYPNEYNGDQNCIYHLSSIHNYPINLTFVDFQLEWHKSCKYDYVEIHVQGEPTRTLCGTHDAGLQFKLGSSVTIRFHSDAHREFKGFYAVFREIINVTDKTTTENSFSTEMESSGSLFITSSSIEVETRTSTIMSRPFTSYPTFASSISGNTDYSVPLIAGIVAGIVICTIIIAAIVIWFLRKKPLKQKHQPKAFGNENYNMQHISKENISSSVNDNVTYCNVQNNIPTEKTVEVQEENSSFIHHQSTTSEYNYATTKNGFRSSIGDVNKTESDYIDQEDSYNILNVNPSKTSTTENIYDRSIEGAYDSAQTFATQSSQDVGTYDRCPANGDNDYDTAQDIMSRDDSYIYS